MKKLTDVPGFENFDFEKIIEDFFLVARSMESIDFFIKDEERKTKYIELREDLLKHARCLWKLHAIPFLAEAYFSDKYTPENKIRWVKMALEDVSKFQDIVSSMKSI